MDSNYIENVQKQRNNKARSISLWNAIEHTWNAMETQNLADLVLEVWLTWGQNDLCEAGDQTQIVRTWHFHGLGGTSEKAETMCGILLGIVNCIQFHT